MKKKAKGKSKAGSASAPSRGKAAKPAKRGSAAKGKAKAPANKAPKPGVSASRRARAKPGAGAKTKPARAAKAAKAAKPGASAQAKPATRPAKAASKAKARAGTLLRKVAPQLREEAGRDTEVILAPELIAKTLPESVPAEDEGALRKVMSSLTALFGGRDLFVRAFTEKLMMYALGRELQAYDMPQVRAVVRRAALRDNRLSAIVSGIVSSDAFRMQALPVTRTN